MFLPFFPNSIFPVMLQLLKWSFPRCDVRAGRVAELQPAELVLCLLTVLEPLQRPLALCPPPAPSSPVPPTRGGTKICPELWGQAPDVPCPERCHLWELPPSC